GSLFQLLCTARTRAGEDTLARWLLAPADRSEIGERQVAVAELRPLLDLREDLGLLGANLRTGVDLGGLAQWGSAPPILIARWPRLVAPLLAAINVAAVVAWIFFGLATSLLFLAFLLGAGFALAFHRRTRQ